MNSAAGDPVDWNGLYAIAETPWDLGAPVSLLVTGLSDGILPSGPGLAVVPGAGRGHDAAALAHADWTAVAVDLSPVAVDIMRATYPDVTAVLGDALDPEVVLAHAGGAVDLLWDHTFFCALPPTLRPRVGDLARAVVKPGGLLASAIWPIGRDDAEGPPFRYEPDDMDAVLDGFERISVGPAVSRTPDSTWPMRLGVWRRR